MKTLRKMFVLALCITLASVLNAQVSRIVYASDGLSGELQVRAADCNTGQILYWTIQLPQNQMVQVTRVNNTYFLRQDGISILENENNSILSNTSIGTFKDTLTNANSITVLMNDIGATLVKDPICIIRFAAINTDATSASTGFGGNVDIFNGMLNVTGSQVYMGSNVSAVLGGNYSDFTCFGSPQGGRIRGSNEGYLLLEANPNGYGNKNVYINRYLLGGNVLMTSSTGKVGLGLDNPQEKLHIAGAVRGNGPGGALDIRTQHGTLTLGAQDTTSALFSTDRKKFRFNKDVTFDKPLFLSTVEINGGWQYSYLQWNAHSLVMGTPAGHYAHNAIELRPGGAENQAENLYSSIAMYTATGLNQQTKKIELKTEGNSWFNTGGNIGIGTDNPLYDLDVKGTIHAEEILVSVPGGADFVFGEDYQLRPLNEVNAFIQENKHLPEIQSAADMQENGVSMSDFQIQLLQKIEELTLYIIQQDQQIQELKQQVNNLTH